jgi:hypothetical protein
MQYLNMAFLLTIDVHLDQYTRYCVMKTIGDLSQKRIDGFVEMNHFSGN